MNSRDFLVINGQYNSNDYGLWVDTPPMDAMAEQKTSAIVIPGREESLYSTKDEYEDVTKQIKAYSFSNDFNINAVYNWLRTAKTFYFNSNPRTYYRVKKLNGITPNYQGHGKNIITITFVVSPFRYLVDDEVLSFTDKSFTVQNDGNHYARPVYRIVGTGDITLATETFTGETIEELKLYDVASEVTVDAERLYISEAGRSVRTEGVIPLLDTGLNKFKVTGNVTAVHITRNQRDV